MSDRSESGRLFGIPYNFERPNIRRLFSSYWQPSERMLVEKPFGFGYTLNLANWRSWIVIGVALALVFHEQSRSLDESTDGETNDEPVEVIIEDD